jgi:hypothetical protein
MVGFIITRSLLAHPSLIVREFGMPCFARCIWRTLTSGRNVTFLECIPFPPSSESAVGRSSMGKQFDGEDTSPATQVAHMNLAAVDSDAPPAN